MNGEMHGEKSRIKPQEINFALYSLVEHVYNAKLSIYMIYYVYSN